MYKISFFDVSTKEKKYLSQKFKENKKFSVDFYSSPLTIKSAKKAKSSEIVATFISSKIDQNIIDNLPKLKLITTMSTGFDHIDLDYCKEKNITACNVPEYGSKTVAEHTFALILSLSRKIPQSVENVKNFDFDLDDLCGFDLEKKTIGLIGIGNIGINVAKIAKGFDMKVIASDPKPNKKLTKKMGIKIVSLKKLLRDSDIISLHAPYNKHTHHLINQDNIKTIKPGAYIVNTARGGLIDTEALINALDKKIVAGAALDVLEEERMIGEEKEILKNPNHNNEILEVIIRNHLLLKHPRVIITPHNAFNSKEALQRILDTTTENIERFSQKKPINVIKN